MLDNINDKNYLNKKSYNSLSFEEENGLKFSFKKFRLITIINIPNIIIIIITTIIKIITNSKVIKIVIPVIL
jgi:hypothetical protein